ncbi:MAG: hypothetical protein AAFY71_01440 [Bacteroidota bacterium]
MKFFRKLFGTPKKEESPSGFFLVASLNEKIMPVDRGVVYEDPLEHYLQENELGEISGGGTMQMANGEIEYVDIEIHLFDDQPSMAHVELVVKKLEELGAPKGSRLRADFRNESYAFGQREGIGIYLDGQNLPDEVYQQSNINDVVAELQQAIGQEGELIRYWEGAEETALYFYGDSFEKMKQQTAGFLSYYPLCQGARVVQLA